MAIFTNPDAIFRVLCISQKPKIFPPTNNYKITQLKLLLTRETMSTFPAQALSNSRSTKTEFDLILFYDKINKSSLNWHVNGCSRFASSLFDLFYFRSLSFSLSLQKNVHQMCFPCVDVHSDAPDFK